MLSSRINSRIFQNKSVPDIAKALFREHGFSDFEDQLSASYAAAGVRRSVPRIGFGFVSRILAHAGIYYYFRHEENRHVLVLADAASAHATVPGLREGGVSSARYADRAEADEVRQQVGGRPSMAARARMRATTSISSGRRPT